MENVTRSDNTLNEVTFSISWIAAISKGGGTGILNMMSVFFTARSCHIFKAYFDHVHIYFPIKKIEYTSILSI